MSEPENNLNAALVAERNRYKRQLAAVIAQRDALFVFAQEALKVADDMAESGEPVYLDPTRIRAAISRRGERGAEVKFTAEEARRFDSALKCVYHWYKGRSPGFQKRCSKKVFSMVIDAVDYKYGRKGVPK